MGKCLRKINQRIVELRSPDYQIGHSNFLSMRDIDNNSEKLAFFDDVWNYQIISRLKEYFYSQADLLRQVLPSFYSPDEDRAQPAGGPATLHGEELIGALNRL